MLESDGFVRICWHRLKWLRFRNSLPVGAVESLRIVESENPFSDYRPEVDSAESLRWKSQVNLQFAGEHNAIMMAIDSAKREEHKRGHLERIRERKARRRLESAVAKWHRFNAMPVVSPIVVDHAHAPLPILSEDRTEAELQSLLADVPSEYRLDIAAECWIVRADHPSAPALHVFRRAMENCKLVRRGIYSRREESRIRQHGISENWDGNENQDTARNAAKWWQEQCEQANKRERMELALLVLRTQAGNDIVDALLQGKTRAEVAAQFGISQATLSRRLSVFAPKESVAWSTERNSVFVRTV